MGSRNTNFFYHNFITVKSTHTHTPLQPPCQPAGISVDLPPHFYAPLPVGGITHTDQTHREGWVVPVCVAETGHGFYTAPPVPSSRVSLTGGHLGKGSSGWRGDCSAGVGCEWGALGAP